jgi:S-adenosylmethionine hydrolase
MIDAFLNGAPGVADICGRTVPLVSTYADVQPGDLCAVVSSGDSLEVAVNGGSAALAVSTGRGAAVHVRRVRDTIPGR